MNLRFANFPFYSSQYTRASCKKIKSRKAQCRKLSLWQLQPFFGLGSAYNFAAMFWENDIKFSSTFSTFPFSWSLTPFYLVSDNEYTMEDTIISGGKYDFP